MPSINRIITSFQNIEFSKPSFENIDKLFFDLEIENSASSKKQNYSNFKRLDFKKYL